MVSAHSFPTLQQTLTQSQEEGSRKEAQRRKAFTNACMLLRASSLHSHQITCFAVSDDTDASSTLALSS